MRFVCDHNHKTPSLEMCKMIKYTVFLVVLFSFSQADDSLEEIRKDLTNINPKDVKFNVSSLLYPTKVMHRNPCICLPAFLRDLRSMLDHITTHHEIVKQLKDNTDFLRKNKAEEKAVKCNIRKRASAQNNASIFLENNIKYIQNWNEKCSKNKHNV